MENRNKYKLFIKNGKIVYIEENKKTKKIKMRYGNTKYTSGIRFLKDVLNIELNNEPTYSEIKHILKEN